MMKQYVRKIIDQYTKAPLGEETKEAFHNWLTDNDLSEEKESALYSVWNNPSPVPIKSGLNLLAAVKSKNMLQTNSTKRVLIRWRYAAAVALMICATTAYIATQYSPSEPRMIEQFTQAGRVDSLTLPDGSVVMTNSRTILLYSESFGSDNRTVYLSGEANFKVAKNEELPFIVKSNDFSITALGTEFNVSSYAEDNYFKATLIEGSIRIDQEGSEDDYTLSVRDQFVFNKLEKGYTIAKADLALVTAWQSGELIFRSATIEEVLRALECKYGVSFQYKANVMNDDKYNFRFKQEASVAEMMEIIKRVAGNITYKEVDDSYYIK